MFSCDENNRVKYVRWPIHERDFPLSPKDCADAHYKGEITLPYFNLNVKVNGGSETYLATKDGHVDLTTGECFGKDFV